MADAPTVGVCFSGGKDSTLAAILLEPFYDVTLVSCTFGLAPVADNAQRAADSVGLELETVDLDRAVAAEAAARIVDDGYPRAGIQQVHEHALEQVAAAGFTAVADGTRRDDRAPTVDRPFAQSLEDRHGVDYVRPLAGYGRGAIDDLAARLLVVETAPSERLAKGDYETELRALIADEYGRETVDDVFPEHVQSRVTGRQP